MFNRDTSQPWHPSYWLASLGAGGLSISFFMYLFWMVPHQDTPMPTFAHWTQALMADSTSPVMQVIVLLSVAAILALGLLHIALLVWNIKEYNAHKGTEAFNKLVNSPAEVQMLAIPLTLAMTVNVMFIFGALFVPGLWSVVEWMFPGAIAAFVVIGYFALKMYGRYLGRMLTQGGYRSEEHNHLSPLMAAFTFSMISVGFAAPAAMSHIPAVIATASVLSYLFLVAAVLVVLFVLVSGITAMMKHGLQEQATPSLWMLVPIITLLGIEWIRMEHGLAHLFNTKMNPADNFQMLTLMVMLQAVVLAVGYRVMKLNGYLDNYLHGDERSPVAFGLVCPGVAFFVLNMFWWHIGFVSTGIVAKFGIIYWIGIALFFVVQTITVSALFRLTRNLLTHRELVLEPSV